MKRRGIVIACAAMILMVVFFFRYHRSDDSALVQSCAKINNEIMDDSFFKATLEEEGIRLLDRDGNLLKTITYEGYRKEPSIIYIRQEGPKIYFITSGAVDDESGYVFINDKSNLILDHINQIERRGRNAYKYSSVATW